MNRYTSASSERHVESAMPWVIGALVLFGAAALLIAVLPIATCDWCNGSGRSGYFRGDEPPPCFSCAGKGRITPLKKWMDPLQ
ncbi:MAG TPA: hypothetical protein VF950_23210 [Planctomycetota bacterium]